jgi:hypothetical protein
MLKTVLLLLPWQLPTNTVLPASSTAACPIKTITTLAGLSPKCSAAVATALVGEFGAGACKYQVQQLYSLLHVY